MHELSLLDNVREILEEEAIRQHFGKVMKVTLEIGKLSCVEPEALRFGFDIVMKGSLAEHAELVISELDGLGYCRQCRRQTPMAALYEPCAFCGSPDIEVIGGMEMKIKDLTVN